MNDRIKTVRQLVAGVQRTAAARQTKDAALAEVLANIGTALELLATEAESPTFQVAHPELECISDECSESGKLLLTVGKKYRVLCAYPPGRLGVGSVVIENDLGTQQAYSANLFRKPQVSS